MEISKSAKGGLTLGDLRALLVDAAALDLSDATKVYARCAIEFTLERPPTAVAVTLIGDRNPPGGV